MSYLPSEEEGRHYCPGQDLNQELVGSGEEVEVTLQS